MATKTQATMDVALYTDPANYARERQRIFSRSWLLIAHESELSRPGSLVAATVAGFPLLVVRDELGSVRGFHNVCRHRAGPLAQDGEGECGARLTCRYHGWSYALDGRLASARDFGPAADFDPRDFSLFPVRCESWRGFVFVNADLEAEPVERAIAPLAAKLENVKLDGYRVAHRASHTVRCNWKTYVENYLEGYHVPLIHPGLTATTDVTRYEVEVTPPAIFHRAPTKGDAAVAGVWAWLWPNLGINVYSDAVLLERMTPVTAGAMQIDYLLLAPKHATREDLQTSIEASLATTREDIEIVEAVQKNLDAGVYRVGRLSPKHEQAVAWFQSEVVRTLQHPGRSE
jgi:choline monooxygenase